MSHHKPCRLAFLLICIFLLMQTVLLGQEKESDRNTAALARISELGGSASLQLIDPPMSEARPTIGLMGEAFTDDSLKLLQDLRLQVSKTFQS